MKIKRVTAFVLAALMAVSMTACGGGNKEDSAKKDNSGNKGTSATNTDFSKYPGTPGQEMITVNLTAEPPEMNSMLTTDAASGDILRECMEGLVKLNQNDQPVAGMAKSWEISDDKTTYTFHIRDDAKWTNGDPVTADDFVYAWTKILTPKTGAKYSYMISDNIKNANKFYKGKCKLSDVGFKAIDKHTLKVQFESAYPYALGLLAFPTYLPLNKNAYEKIGADKYAKDADKIVTNGPYKIAKWQHDDSIVLEKFKDYYAANEILIPKIKFVMLKDINAQMNAFKAGQLDVIRALNGEQMEQMKSQGQPIITYQDAGSWYFSFNCKKKGLDNAKVRKALTMSIDTKALCDNVFKDGSVPAKGLVPNVIAGIEGKPYTDGMKPMVSFNKDEAKKLLEEGLKESGLTIDTFHPTIITDDTSGAQKQATFYQQQWKQNLGLTVQIQPMPFMARINAMQKGNYEISVAGWSPDYNDAMTYLDMFTTGNGNNNSFYSNPEYDKLIKEAAKEGKNLKKRQELLQKAEKILIEDDMAVGPLYWSTVSYTKSGKVQGETRTAFQEFDFTDGAKITKAK